MAKIPFFLSKKDETVPDDYVGIYTIFSDARYALPGFPKESWCLKENVLSQLRTQTYKEVRKRFDASNIVSFASFWNGNLDAINQMGLNAFCNLECFYELSDAMICFEKIDRIGQFKTKGKLISFGIKKDIYKRYYMSLKKAVETGTIPEKVSLHDSKKRNRCDLMATAKATFNFPKDANGNSVVMPVTKNEVYLMFEEWCKIKNKKPSVAIYEAMQLLVKQYPVETEKKKLSDYSISNGLNENETIYLRENVGNQFVSLRLPESTYKTVCSIVRRYNKDPENITKEPLTIQNFIIQAVIAFIKKMPLRYSDPVAYEQYLSLKQKKEYNEQDFNKKGES